MSAVVIVVEFGSLSGSPLLEDNDICKFWGLAIGGASSS